MIEVLLSWAIALNLVSMAFHIHMIRLYRKGLKNFEVMSKMFAAIVDPSALRGLCGMCGDPVQILTFPGHAQVVHPDIDFPEGWPTDVPMVVGEL